MNTAARLFLAATLTVVLGAATGCEKKVLVVVHNFTSEPLPIRLASEGIGDMPIGTAGQDGRESLRYEITNNKSMLPATYTLRAGNWSKDFLIDKQTTEKIYFSITPEKGIVGPTDKDEHVTIEYKTEEKTILHEGPVIK